WMRHVALERRLDAIETDAVVTAAHERNIFGVRPAKRHCSAGRATAFHSHTRQILTVPDLFGQHPAFIGKIFHRLDERLRVPAGSQFVMAAFASQNRPATTYARSVESAAVILLPVAIVIIT